MKETTDQGIASAEPRIGRWLSEGVLLAAMPLGALALSWIFELGYADALHIPSAFVTVSFAQVALSTPYLIAVFGGFLFCVGGAMAMPKETAARWKQRVFPPLVALLCFLPPVVYVSAVANFQRMALAGMFGLAVAGLILVLQLPRRQKPAASNAVAPLATENAFIARLRPYWLLVVVTVYLFACVMMGMGGSFIAGLQTDFLVIPGPPDRVVLRAYGDRFLCARFDRASRHVYPVFSVVKVGDDPNLTYELERVGPLRPASSSRDELSNLSAATRPDKNR